MKSLCHHLRSVYGLEPVELMLLTMPLAAVLEAASDDDRATLPPPAPEGGAL